MVIAVVHVCVSGSNSGAIGEHNDFYENKMMRQESGGTYSFIISYYHPIQRDNTGTVWTNSTFRPELRKFIFCSGCANDVSALPVTTANWHGLADNYE